MSKLRFYFDPMCPWTWRASLWAREASKERPLDIVWKFFSLAEANNLPGDETAPRRLPLRLLAQARREGGNEAVNQTYLALGQAFHESGRNLREEGALAEALREVATGGAIDAGLMQRAQDDPSTWQEVLSEHREATEQYKAYGSPWLVLEGQAFGFNGPIMDRVPRGETAGELWDHVSYLMSQPYFYEFKRPR